MSQPYSSFYCRHKETHTNIAPHYHVQHLLDFLAGCASTTGTEQKLIWATMTKLRRQGCVGIKEYKLYSLPRVKGGSKQQGGDRVGGDILLTLTAPLDHWGLFWPSPLTLLPPLLTISTKNLQLLLTDCVMDIWYPLILIVGQWIGSQRIIMWQTLWHQKILHRCPQSLHNILVWFTPLAGVIHGNSFNYWDFCL